MYVLVIYDNSDIHLHDKPTAACLGLFLVNDIRSKTLSYHMAVYSFAASLVSGCTQNSIFVEAIRHIVLVMTLIAPYPALLSDIQTFAAKFMTVI